MRRPLIALAGALAAIAFLPGQAGAATLVADYRFDDNLNSSVGTAPPLTPVLPPGIFTSSTVDGVPDRAYAWTAGGGLQLPLSAIPNPASYSTVVTFGFDIVADYRRILAFDTYDADNDNGLYDHDGMLSFYDEESFPGPDVVLADNVYADVAFTRGDGIVTAYANGVEQITHPDPTEQAVIRADGLRYFKDDGNNENGSGQVARIRFYDGALTGAEVADIEQTGGLRSTAAAVGKPKAGPKKKKPKSVSAGISLACPAEGVPCPIAAKVTTVKKGKARTIGTLTGQLPAGASVVPGIALSKKGRKLLAKKGKLKIAVEASVTAGSGTVATAVNEGRV